MGITFEHVWIQQLCEDTGCSPEDLPEAMNYREKWRERVNDIRASGTMMMMMMMMMMMDIRFRTSIYMCLWMTIYTLPYGG